MHLCIYVYSLHAYIMKENGKAAIQRHLARLEEWATRSLVKFSEDKRKVLDVGRKEPWQEYKPGLPGRDVFFKEQCGPAGPRPGSWSWGRPSTGRALSREEQCHGAGNRVHWQTLTEKEMKGFRAQLGAPARQQRAEEGLEPGTAGVSLPGLMEPGWAEIRPWTGRVAGGPKGSWAGQLNSYEFKALKCLCLQNLSVLVGTRWTVASSVPQQQGPPTASLLWAEAQPGAKGYPALISACCTTSRHCI